MKTRVALRVTACPCDVRFTPKADTCSALTHVRFVPIADILLSRGYPTLRRRTDVRFTPNALLDKSSARPGVLSPYFFAPT